MTYEKIKRNLYVDPDNPSYVLPHTGKKHDEDFICFHIPLERLHNSNLHDWGIAQGLEVSGTIGGNEIIVNPGVAVDINGQLISLSSLGGGIGENPPKGESEKVEVPVHLGIVSDTDKTVYVTIQFYEILLNEGTHGKMAQVPWIRLQTVDDYEEGKSIVLAIAEINVEGELVALKASDSDLPHRRRLIGESIEELRIERSSKIGDEVQDILSGKIGHGDSGGIKITVPDTQDSILFAREDGGEFSNLEIRANVGICTMNPSAKLEVNGNIKASDVELENLLVQGNVGIGTTNAKNKLEISGGNIAISDNSHGVGKIRLWEESINDNDYVSHAIGTEPYYNVYGAGVKYKNSIGHKFYGGGGELIAQLGLGGSGKNDGRLNSYFAGNVRIEGEFSAGKISIGSNLRHYDMGMIFIGPTSKTRNPLFPNSLPKSFNSSLTAEVEGDNQDEESNRALNFLVGLRWSRLGQDIISPIINEIIYKPFADSRILKVGDNWTFFAKNKNFSISHPLYPETHDLIHSTLEGPESAVFYRGEAKLSTGEIVVLLPDYFEALTRKENRTVLLTPKFEGEVEISMLAASEVKDGKFTVKMIDSKNPSQKFYWEVKAIRADVEKLEVEREKIPAK
ncbi:hypothetical protein [Methanosarcina sp.]|uniref:hypothetical protein n=1 Tax=Methanosarcina sp. TaxID=2213 RepID=UPI003BB573FD